jgi:hypothetical protein
MPGRFWPIDIRRFHEFTERALHVQEFSNEKSPKRILTSAATNMCSTKSLHDTGGLMREMSHLELRIFQMQRSDVKTDNDDNQRSGSPVGGKDQSGESSSIPNVFEVPSQRNF